MKLKNTAWTAEEDAALAQAVIDKISTARLSVRLRRSENTIKRRMRELGLTDKNHSHWRSRTNLEAQVKRWLDAAAARNLVALMACYAPDASLECACSGSAVFAGYEAIQQYWMPKLRSPLAQAFSHSAVRIEGGRAVVDYLCFEEEPVRMLLTFDDAGRISHSECGPRRCLKNAA